MSDASQPSPAPAPARRKTSMRAKLISLALMANMAGIIVAVFVARSIRSGRVPADNEGLWMFAYYGAMLVVGLFDAFLVDELLFGGSFRRTYLEGRDARHIEREGDDAQLAAVLSSHKMSFPVTVIVCSGLTYFAFNLANNDFDTYHANIGRHLTALRSDDPQAQKDAVATLSIQRAAPVLPALIGTLNEGGEAGAWAAWALGRFGDLPRRHPVVTPLVAAARSDDPAIRREALIALGRLQHRAMAPYIHEEIRGQLDAGEKIDPRLLYALGSIQHLSSVPLLTELLHGSDEDTQRMAAWALAQHRDQREGRAVVDVLEERLPSATLDVRCALVHALGILADERSNLALIHAYDDATPQEHSYVCPRITFGLRPDGEDDAVMLLRPERKFGMKVILSMGGMRATSASVRAEVEPWLRALVANESALYEVREGGSSLLKGIVGGRNDDDAKSVEEALGLPSDK